MRNKSIDKALGSVLAFAGIGVSLFVTTSGVTDPVNVPKMLLITPLAFAAFALGVNQFRRVDLKELRLTLIFSSLFLLALACSTAFGGAPFSQAFFGTAGRNTGFVTYFSLLLIFFSSTIVRHTNFARNLVPGILFVGVINVLYGFLQLTHNDPLPWNNTYNTILGTFGNPDFASAFLGMTAVVAVAVLLGNLRNWKAILFSATYLVISIFEIKKSHAIQGFAVTAIGVAVVGFFFIRSKTSGNILLVGYSILIACLGVLAGFGALQIGPLSKFVYKGSVSLRGEYWAGAINTGRDHPLFGVGLDSYGDWYRFERRPSAIVRPGPDTVVNTAHNVFLDMFANGGYFLLISYLAILFLTVLALFRLAKRQRAYDITFVALSAAWIGYQAQAAISINQIGLAIWGWLLAGALISYEISTRTNQSENNSTDSKKLKRQTNRGSTSMPASAILASSAAGLIGLLLALPPLMADNRWYNAAKNRKVELLQQAGLAWPRDSNRMANIAITLAQNKFNQQALVVAREAVKFNPRSLDAWKVLSLIETATPSEKAEAIKHLKELDPLNTEIK